MKTSTPSETASPTEEDRLVQEAVRIDLARASQEKENPVDQVINGEAPAAEPEVKPPTADPIMVTSLTFLVSSGVRLLHKRFEWTEPDDKWKTDVATVSALIIDKYIPVLMEGQSDVIALVLLVGPYVLDNVIRKATSGSGSDPGTEGLGQEHFVESPVEDEKTRFPHPA